MGEMGTNVEIEVPYTISNIERCQCPECPVQADSECAQERYSRLKNELESPGGVDALEPEKVPGIYFRQVLLHAWT
jgi:hypothetical protein